MRRAGAILCLLLFGCQTSPPPAASGPAPAPAAVAYVNGQPVTLADLAPTLFDLAGREALRELILDRALARQGVTVSEQQVAAERRRMLTMLSDDPDEAARLLAALRQRRGLGDARFRALLRRNAALRALVADQVVVTPPAVQRAYALRYGPRYRARVIVTRTLERAAELRALAAEQPFADLALEHSQDSSALAGGLLPPISPADDTYPAAIREALTTMRAGEVSDPISVEGGFAIVRLEGTIPASDIPLEAVHEELEQQARLQTEQRLMDQLARRLIDEVQVVILDGDLSRVWQAGEPRNN